MPQFTLNMIPKKNNNEIQRHPLIHSNMPENFNWLILKTKVQQKELLSSEEKNVILSMLNLPRIDMLASFVNFEASNVYASFEDKRNVSPETARKICQHILPQGKCSEAILEIIKKQQILLPNVERFIKLVQQNFDNAVTLSIIFSGKKPPLPRAQTQVLGLFSSTMKKITTLEEANEHSHALINPLKFNQESPLARCITKKSQPQHYGEVGDLREIAECLGVEVNIIKEGEISFSSKPAIYISHLGNSEKNGGAQADKGHFRTVFSDNVIRGLYPDLLEHSSTSNTVITKLFNNSETKKQEIIARYNAEVAYYGLSTLTDKAYAVKALTEKNHRHWALREHFKNLKIITEHRDWQFFRTSVPKSATALFNTEKNPICASAIQEIMDSIKRRKTCDKNLHTSKYYLRRLAGASALEDLLKTLINSSDENTASNEYWNKIKDWKTDFDFKAHGEKNNNASSVAQDVSRVITRLEALFKVFKSPSPGN